MFSNWKQPSTKMEEEKEESDESDSEQLVVSKDEELQELKARYQQELKSLEKHEEELTRDNEYKEKFIKHISTLREKDSALVEWEKTEVLQKQAKLESLKEETLELVKRKEELERQVRNHSVYKDIIESVCNMSKFQNVDTLTAHLENLNYIRVKYTTRLVEMEKKIEQERKEQLMLKEKHKLLLLQKNTELLQLQTELAETRSEALKWEGRWNHIQDTASKKTLELGKIKMATHNLYEMTKGKLGGVEDVDINDTEKQLDQIILFFEDHMDILKQYDVYLQRNANGKKHYKAPKHNVQKY